MSREKGGGAQAAPVLCMRAGIRSPRAAAPETPRAAGTGSTGKHLRKRTLQCQFFREPVTGADCDSAGKGGCRVSQTQLIRESFPPEYPSPSGAVLRKTVVCSGVCWMLICMCVCVYSYMCTWVYMYIHLCVYMCTLVCVLGWVLLLAVVIYSTPLNFVQMPKHLNNLKIHD